MKLFAFLFLLFSFSACNDFEFNEKDDGSISGTVSFIWNQIGISSSHAQTPQDALDELSSLSLGADLFIQYADATYSDSIAFALTEVQSYSSQIGGLITSNVASFSADDFTSGAVLAMGFNSSNKIVSLTLARVNAVGAYSLNDSAYKSVAFYKLAFILDNGGLPKYRLSYIFRDGSKMRANVTEVTTIRSAKLSEELASNPTASAADLKAVYRSQTAVVQAPLSSDDESLIGLYLNQHYGNYSSLNPVQKFMMDASIYLRMNETPAMRTVMESRRAHFENFILVGRPNTLDAYCNGDPELEDVLYNKVETSVTNLSTVGVVPVIIGGRL